MPDDIGTNMLLEGLYECKAVSTLENLNLHAHETIKNWLLGFETDPDVIAERQEEKGIHPHAVLLNKRSNINVHVQSKRNNVNH